MPAADLTFIINTNSALSMSLGFFNGPLLRTFGYRKISVVASILFSLGLILTSMVNTVFGFVITYGLITGEILFYLIYMLPIFNLISLDDLIKCSGRLRS